MLVADKSWVWVKLHQGVMMMLVADKVASGVEGLIMIVQKGCGGVISFNKCYTVWRIIFVGANFRKKSDKAPRINFCGFKFRGCKPCSLQVRCSANDKRMM